MQKALKSVLSFMVIFLSYGICYAEELSNSSPLGDYFWAIAIGAGIGIGIAAFGGALGQGNVSGKALEGIARNPGSRDQVFVPLILSLAFIESLVLYALLITYLLQSRLPSFKDLIEMIK